MFMSLSQIKIYVCLLCWKKQNADNVNVDSKTLYNISYLC